MRDARHAYAVLQGLTSGSGAMVAAATTSLPERLEGGRNYDYRYAWIRDQCYAGLAVAAHGPHPLLEGTVRFLTERILADGPGLMPAYTVGGERIPDERNAAAARVPRRRGPGGEPGDRPVPAGRAGGVAGTAGRRRAAGHAGRGELAGRRRGGRRDRPALDRGPTQGIWELDDQHWAHSRLTCVSGLRSLAAAAEGPPGGHGHRQAAEWSALADTIQASLGDCVHPTGRWQRSPTDPRVDAALLLPVIRGALPADDPRARATVARGPRGTGRGRVRVPVPPRRPAAAQGRGRVPALRVLAGAGRPGMRAGRGGGALVRAQPRGLRPGRACTPRSTTCTSASCGATCRRPSCTRGCWRRRSGFPVRPRGHAGLACLARCGRLGGRPVGGVQEHVRDQRQPVGEPLVDVVGHVPRPGRH